MSMSCPPPLQTIVTQPLLGLVDPEVTGFNLRAGEDLCSVVSTARVLGHRHAHLKQHNSTRLIRLRVAQATVIQHLIDVCPGRH